MKDSKLDVTIKIDENTLEFFRKSKVKVNRGEIDTSGKSGSFIVMTAGPQTGRVVFIDKPIISIGRDDDADIVIKKTLISRDHARLVLTGKQVCISDQGSTNGTFVNKKRITRRILKDGDEIQTGEVVWQFFTEELSPNKTVPATVDKKSSDFYTAVFNECEPYFGNSTRQFLYRQIAVHDRKTPQTISLSDRDELVKWIKISASLFLDEPDTIALVNKIKTIKK